MEDKNVSSRADLTLKDILILIFLAAGIYCMATEAYHVYITPLPAAGADLMPH